MLCILKIFLHCPKSNVRTEVFKQISQKRKINMIRRGKFWEMGKKKRSSCFFLIRHFNWIYFKWTHHWQLLHAHTHIHTHTLHLTHGPLYISTRKHGPWLQLKILVDKSELAYSNMIRAGWIAVVERAKCVWSVKNEGQVRALWLPLNI